MRPTKKLIIVIFMLGIPLLLSGCWDQKIFERIGFILQIGLELVENGKIHYTAGVPVISPEAEERSEILSTTITHMREGRDKLHMVSGKALGGGKTQQIFFSEGLASKGINEFLEIFLRSLENCLLANVVIVEGSPYELMKISEEYKDKPRPTFYVNSLLDSAKRNSYVPETRIYNFSILTHSGTIDPVTPAIRYNSKEIEVSGGALFSGDKMTGKINIREMGVLNSLMDVKNNIEYIYQGPYSSKSSNGIKTGSTILMKNKKRKIDVRVDGETPIININIELKGSLSEYSGELDLKDPKDKKKLEDSIAESFEKDCTRLLKYLTEVESDPIGIGEIVRTKHNKYWKSIKWKDVYKNAAFKVEAKITLEFYGAMTNP